jgi:tRNA1(Val) A37 N6-methylase TrmN6
LYHTPDSPELTCDAITADYRIYQRRRGHRFSLDDLATAHQAAHAVNSPARMLDMGCGIGSVLLMLAWRFGDTPAWGIEALDASADLADRSVALNRLTDRVRILRGDLRDVTRELAHAPIDLVTGTPPYLPEGTALVSPDPQRAAARIELRGGVEDYIRAGARVLSERGKLVLCADGRRPERVLDTTRALGLHPELRSDIWPRPDAQTPLFSVWTLALTRGVLEERAIVIRGDDGEQTPEAKAFRATFGL